MNAGNKPINVRFSAAEMEEIEEEVLRNNTSPQCEPMTKSDFVRLAVREFIRKRVAGRKEKYESELWQRREPGVPPL